MQHTGSKVISIAQPSRLPHSLSPTYSRISGAHTSLLAVYRDQGVRPPNAILQILAKVHNEPSMS